MSTYTPDKWVVIKTDVSGLHYRILASWYGGYLGSDSWKISSGITSITETDTDYHISNESGSLYICNKKCLGTSSYSLSIYENYKNIYDKNIFEITSTQDDPLGEAKFLCNNL